MFSIPLLVFSFGIVNIYAQECKDVKMKMSLSKPGRVELDVDQFCRCAGYSKSPITDAPDLSKWKKKPTSDADIVTGKPTKDKISIFKDIDEITDILTENTTEIASERRYTEKDTDTLTEKRVLIDKTPISVTTEETKDKTTEKRDEITHKIFRNMTAESADRVTEKTIVDKEKNSTLVTEKSVPIKDSVKKSTEKVTKETPTAPTTDKYIGIVDKTDFITDVSPSDSLTESSIDMLTVKRVVDKVRDKNSSDLVTKKGSLESDRSLTTKIVTDLVTEKTTVKNITEKSVKEVIDKSPIALMTTEKIEKSGVIIDKSSPDKVSDKSSLKTDMTTEKAVVYKAVEKNSTDYAIDERLKVTESDIDVETEKSVVDTVIHKNATEKGIVLIPIALTTEKVTTEKTYEDKVTESEKVTDVPYKTEKSIVDKTTDKKSTDKSFISLTTEKDTAMTKEKGTMENTTEKISTPEVIIKIPIIALTTEKVTDKTLDKTTTAKAIVRSFIDLTTKRSVDKITGRNVTEKVVDKSIEERITDATLTTETRERVKVTDESYHRNYTPPTTEKVIKHEKNMENYTEVGIGTSHMTKKSGNKLQILLILLAIMVMAGFIFAVCYTVYMSHRSSSYVLPSPNDEATPLNNI